MGVYPAGGAGTPVFDRGVPVPSTEDEARSAALANRLGRTALRDRLEALQQERKQLEEELQTADIELQRAIQRQADEEQALEQEVRIAEEEIAELTKTAAAAEGRCAGAILAARQMQEIDTATTGPDELLCKRQVLAEASAATRLLELREEEYEELKAERAQQVQASESARKRRIEELDEAIEQKQQAEAERLRLTQRVEDLKSAAQVTGDEAAALDQRLREGLLQHQRAAGAVERLRVLLENLQAQASEQERTLEIERKQVIEELGTVGLESVEDLKLAWEQEVRNMREELMRMDTREHELRSKVESARLIAERAAEEAGIAEEEERAMRARVVVARTELEKQRRAGDEELRELQIVSERETERMEDQMNKIDRQLSKRSSNNWNRKH